MIELLWIAIAALGCWNVYVEAKVRAVTKMLEAKHQQQLLDMTNLSNSLTEIFTQKTSEAVEVSLTSQRESCLEWMRTTTQATESLQSTLHAEVARREALECALRQGAVLMHPGHLENLWQWICGRAMQECDPDSILRQMEGKDWEGGCGHS